MGNALAVKSGGAASDVKSSVCVESVRECRVCGNADLIPCLDLGEQYVASLFPSDLGYRQATIRYPLQLVLCKRTKSTCGLVQLAHQIDLSGIYSLYPYSSGTTSTMGEVLVSVSRAGRAVVDLRAGDVILDIGCNDGTLLRAFEAEPYRLIGIDPARNVESVVASDLFVRVKEPFARAVFERVSDRPAKLVFSIAMFYHLQDPVAFSREVASVLAEDGVWIIQMSHLPSMLKANMYDNVVHEHVAYYGSEQLIAVLARAGLRVFRVEVNDVYGGSIRVFACHANSQRYSPESSVQGSVEADRASGADDPRAFREFYARILRERERLKNTCEEIHRSGKRIWVYGASTKGSAILQFCDLDHAVIEAAADRHPLKIGRYLVGSDIPIRSEESLRASRPEFLLALPYAFIDAFISREADLVTHGSRFIVPLPQVRVLPQ